MKRKRINRRIALLEEKQQQLESRVLQVERLSRSILEAARAIQSGQRTLLAAVDGRDDRNEWE
jgi:hypothetical protein